MVPDWAGYLEFRDAFASVMDPERYHIQWLDDRVLSGAALFLRSDNAAIVAEVRAYPTGFREVHGLVAAGDLGEIVGELIPAAEQWGVEQGCGGAIIESRLGWAKALKESGYEMHQVAVRKEFV